jgi:hypothetical protein
MLHDLPYAVPHIPAFLELYLPWLMVAVFGWILFEMTVRHNSRVARSKVVLQQFSEVIERSSQFQHSSRWLMAISRIATALLQIECRIFSGLSWMMESRGMRAAVIVSVICTIYYVRDASHHPAVDIVGQTQHYRVSEKPDYTCTPDPASAEIVGLSAAMPL